MQKKKQAKQVQSMQGYRGGGGCEQARRKDISGKNWIYKAPPPINTLLLTAPLIRH